MVPSMDFLMEALGSDYTHEGRLEEKEL